MKSKTVKLDGVKNGFAIYLNSKNDFVKGNIYYNHEEKKMKLNTNEIKLFSNINTLRSFVETSLKIFNQSEYSLWVILKEEGLQIDFNDVVECGEKYQFFYNDTIYYVSPVVCDKISSIGYFVFNDIEENNIDKLRQINKDLYIMFKNILNDIVKHPNWKNSIVKVGKDKSGHMTAFIKGTTVQIHILYNSQIMDMNVKRKEKETRCLPFNSKMDKFRTIYVYCTKDKTDFSTNNVDDIYNYIIDIICNYIKINYPKYSNMNYTPIDFKGIILI